MLLLSAEEIKNFERDGAICLRNVFNASWIQKVTVGIQQNFLRPSINSESLQDETGGGSIFFNDYCNWRRIPEFEDYIRHSPAAEIAGKLMRSSKSIFYHEHVLSKGSGLEKRTPWHMDQSYYPIDGKQCLSLWMPVDTVDSASSLRFVAGSQLWPQWFVPRKFATSLNYKRSSGEEEESSGGGCHEYVTVPSDDDIEKHTILKWEVQPGDCLVFHMKTLHGTAGSVLKSPRRILSTRWLGDDTVISSRPWEISPSTTGGLNIGDPAISDEFPIIWTRK